MDIRMVPFERGDPAHAGLLARCAALCLRGEREAAVDLKPEAFRAGPLALRPGETDHSRVALADGAPAGLFLLWHEDKADGWELGALHVLPERQSQGIGSAMLAEAEGRARSSAWPVIRTRFYSPRSVWNGIPAFLPASLGFLTKRGFVVKPSAEGAFVLEPARFDPAVPGAASRIPRLAEQGYRLAITTAGEAAHGEAGRRCADFSRREGMPWWGVMFDDAASPDREVIARVERDGDVAACCACTLAPRLRWAWGRAPQWGPLLTGRAHRGRGLASWLVAESLAFQIARGCERVMLWATVGGMPARSIYEPVGFRLACAWFAVEKRLA